MMVRSNLRSSLLGLAITPAAAAPASAGDASTLEVLGFSKDASVFAFEEYGVQDGSGFPYANLLHRRRSDQFLPDTPIRVRIDDESAPISAARDQAREKGERIALDFRAAAQSRDARRFQSADGARYGSISDAGQSAPVFPPVDHLWSFG